MDGQRVIQISTFLNFVEKGGKKYMYSVIQEYEKLTEMLRFSTKRLDAI